MALLATLGQLSLLTGFAAFAIGTLVTWIAAAIMTKGMTHRKTHFSKIDADAMKKFGSGTVFSRIPRYLSLRLDQLLVAGIVSPSSVSLYAAGASAASPLQVAGTTVEQYLFPGLARTRVERRVERLVRWLIAVTVSGVLVGVAVSIFANQLVTLVFGDYYARSSGVAIILTWAGVAWSISVCFAAHLKVAMQLKILVWSQWVGLAVMAAVGVAGAVSSNLLTVAWGVLLARVAVLVWQGLSVHQYERRQADLLG